MRTNSLVFFLMRNLKRQMMKYSANQKDQMIQLFQLKLLT